MNKALITVILIVAAAFVAGGIFLFHGTDKTAQSTNPQGSSLVPVTAQKGSAALPQSAPKHYSQTITIDSQAFFFKPDQFRVKAGEKTTVTVASHGTHTFTIDELKVNVKTEDGKKTQFSFTPNKKGAFHYYSSVPGDREAGQQGTLIVE